MGRNEVVELLNSTIDGQVPLNQATDFMLKYLVSRGKDEVKSSNLVKQIISDGQIAYYFNASIEEARKQLNINRLIDKQGKIIKYY